MVRLNTADMERRERFAEESAHKAPCTQTHTMDPKNIFQ
jgi:hypothetical protein